MFLPVEFNESRPVHVRFPEVISLRVASTGPAQAHKDTSAMKSAVLENGLEILVPLFIKEGEPVRIDTSTKKYRERARES